MKKLAIRHFYTSFIVCNFCLFSLQASSPYLFYTGAETYHFKRAREGGTEQTGLINGTRVGFDRIKPYGWYIGADYLYASGRIKGKTGSGIRLGSELNDQIFEARLGFTLLQPGCRTTFIIPFGGWGSFREVNHFVSPSPLKYKFTDTFDYVVVGFLSGVNLTALISMGINFKVKFMLDGESKVTNDPFYDTVTLVMEKETLYRLDLPITYNPRNSLFGIDAQFVPFYEFRHFGGREGFPFDFKDTKFYLYGARLALLYCF